MAYLMYKYQLLYVYINSYQAGGEMWYAVFSRSMVVLLAGVCTLLCYLAIRMAYTTAPFYLLLPLPVLILLFWHHCEKRIRGPAMVKFFSSTYVNVCLFVILQNYSLFSVCLLDFVDGRCHGA